MRLYRIWKNIDGGLVHRLQFETLFKKSKKERRVVFKIAVAKGRTAEKLQPILEASEDFRGILDLDSRKLIFPDKSGNTAFILVKPTDIPSYVEMGVVDIGIVGKDVLMEKMCSVYEVFDLNICRCRMALAGLPEKIGEKSAVKKVATKYPNIAEHYFKNKRESVEILKLEGSVELAPILGLSEVIVDIVESGATLRENGLVIYEVISAVSTRIIANRISYKEKSSAISRFIDQVKEGGYA